MAYFIRPVERELLPEGKDWIFVKEHDGGDIHFVIAKDAGAVELPICALESVVREVVDHTDITVPLAPTG